ncbi:DHH family phosphoesterase [Candidatus Bathycorpusculum sp.]|uniref:DHH family phosphoesterase n=1 Tax=Candidatus Bathycorpusculum sp. TaxID=2994959 RepID=UPI002820DEE3|nr:DHH family phosphoesterase [Candidatus Termitimicrobium sp.]MCL2686120.1 DHH family phosphoesterase [Candidatus Termitimicrobium sp.]
MAEPQPENISNFLTQAQEAAKIIKETTQKDGFISCFSHLDADGVAAAGIVAKMLQRLDARFRIRVMQWVDDKIITEITSDKPQLVIMSDFGSGYLDLLNEKIPNNKIVILDHHQITGNPTTNPNITMLNPHTYGIDGATDISGSGVAYFAAKALDPTNTDLSPIAIVGALGDMQDKYEQRSMRGLNEIIVNDAINAGLLKVEKDLTFFGRETRPIHRMIATTTNPFIPGLSGQETQALNFITNLGFPIKQNDKLRSLCDLDPQERKTLCSALADYLLSKGLHLEVDNLIGCIYILTKEEPNTALRDGREFSVLLNSTGRMDHPSLGIAICMGDRKTALEESNKLLEDYRKNINKYLTWVQEKPERLQEHQNIYVIYGENAINEKIIGTVSSILVSTLTNNQKPLLAYANIDAEKVAKFSGRTTEAALTKGINLSDVMRLASETHGGKGGGHNIAAGAQVPIDKIEAFIKTADELVGRQLNGEKLASNNNP